jgi:hypothetical protein
MCMNTLGKVRILCVGEELLLAEKTQRGWLPIRAKGPSFIILMVSLHKQTVRRYFALGQCVPWIMDG